MKKGAFFFLLLVQFFFFASVAKADWINLSGAENARNIAEIYIEKDHVLIKLEVFVEDIMVFEELIPDDLFSQKIPNRPKLKERQKIFADQVIQIVADNNKKLPVSFKLVEPRRRIDRPSPFVGMINPYTRRPIPGPPEDKRVLYAELLYPLTKQPQTLTFIPPLDKNGLPRASIGFLCYHEGVTVVDFRLLGDQNKLHLDWDDPWYSQFDKKQMQRKIGAGMRTYLYIEPYEVRNEILVRVKDMMAWLDFDLRGDEYIEEDEFNRLREQVGKFFLERENVEIDGKRLKPILDRTAFVESSMLRSRFIETPERIPLNTAMIGVIITYLTDGIPKEVTTTWELFSERIQKVTARMTDPAGPFPYDLDPEDNVLSWKNYLKNYTIPTVANVAVDKRHKGFPIPLGTVACIFLMVPVALTIRSRKKNSKPLRPMLATFIVLTISALLLVPVLHVPFGGAARAEKINDEDSKTILHSLLKNVYRAFDFREESDIYDKLAVSVSGDLLADIYLQHRKSMVVEQAGGAQAKVGTIDIVDVSVQESEEHSDALDFRSIWTATGTVGHWGHIHTRQNRYDAIITLQPVKGSWKIVDLELLEEKRIDPFASPTQKK